MAIPFFDLSWPVARVERAFPGRNTIRWPAVTNFFFSPDFRVAFLGEVSKSPFFAGLDASG